MNAETIAKSLNGRGSGNQWQCCCPAHDDKNPSLSVSNQEGKVLVHCHSGCSQTDVIFALTKLGLWKENNRNSTRIIDSIYSYVDSTGKVIYESVRYSPKSFSLRRPNGYGGYIYNIQGIEPVVYQLPAVLEGISQNQIIFIVEGEKDVVTLNKLGFYATCNHGGAGKWNEDHSAYLKGAHVIILPDNDKAGREHAIEVIKTLRKYADSIRVLELPNLPEKGDITDWIGAGNSAQQFVLLVNSNAVSADSFQQSQTVLKAQAIRPEIKVIAGNAPNGIERMEQAILSTGIEIYERGDVLVRPIKKLENSIDCLKRSENTLVFTQVDEDWLKHEVERNMDFVKYDKRSKEFHKIDAPLAYVRTYLALRGQRKIPKLLGIVNSPILRKDNTISERPGYDPNTLLLLDFPKSWSFVNSNATQSDARAALDILFSPVSQFPFESLADISVYFSAVLSALQRPLLQTVPMHCFDSPVAGTGKTKLADVISVISTGHRAPVMSWGQKDDESEKRFHSALLAGDQIIVIDNIERPLRSEGLCTYLTQTELSIRLLGESKQIKIPANSFLIGTGNNLMIEGDLTRRVLVSTINAKTERPEVRKFAFDPVQYSIENRSKLLRAAFTILSAYRAAGSPEVGLVPLGSFEQWSREIRSALVWAGATDPCMVIEKSRKTDPERELLNVLLQTWVQNLGSRKVTVGELVTSVMPASDFRFALESISGGAINPQRIGRFLYKFQGKPVDGLLIYRNGIRHGSAVWSVEGSQGSILTDATKLSETNSYDLPKEFPPIPSLEQNREK